MAFKDIDQRLIDECSKNIIDLDKIKSLISNGADINAFDEEYEQELYNEILDYYIDEEQPNLSNLYEITKLFLANNLVPNQKPEDSDCFSERICSILRRSDKPLCKEDNGQIEEEYGQRRAYRIHGIYSHCGMHVIGKHREESRKKLEHRVSRRVTHFQFV